MSSVLPRVALQSASYRAEIDTLGGSHVAPRLVGSLFSMDVTLAHAFPPPGEVRGVGFSDTETIFWSAERSVGSYRLYRGSAEFLPFETGRCLYGALPVATATDELIPEEGGLYFYLVTARNLLEEEGRVGFDGAGDPRIVPEACP